MTDIRQDGGAADKLASFEHDGRTFWHAPGDAPASASPTGHLLQVLDEMYRGYQDSRWMIDAEGGKPRARESAIGMALVDAQLVAAMRRTVTRRPPSRSGPHRGLHARELKAIRDAAARYG